MKNYLILTECLSCGQKKVWHMESLSEDEKIILNEAVMFIDTVVFADGYELCCPQSPLFILSTKEETEYPF